MRRIVNLALFGVVSLVVVMGLLWAFRGQALRLFGVSFDTGAAAETALVLPEGYQADIFASGLTRMRNQNLVGMVRWQEGGFMMGLEWMYSRTTDSRFADPLTGNQISLSGNYYF